MSSVKPKSGKYAVVCVASGFTGPTIVKTTDSKLEALQHLETAFKDYRENNWSHDKEPTLYMRLDPEVLAIIDFEKKQS